MKSCHRFFEGDDVTTSILAFRVTIDELRCAKRLHALSPKSDALRIKIGPHGGPPNHSRLQKKSDSDIFREQRHCTCIALLTEQGLPVPFSLSVRSVLMMESFSTVVHYKHGRYSS